MRKVHYPARTKVLVDLIQRYGLKTVVELGVEAGETHMALLRECPDLQVVGVDTWRGTRKGESRAKYYKTLVRDVERYDRYRDRSELLRMRTVPAAERFEDGSFDLVFVDADHSYTAVKGDIAAWLPKLTPHGWMTGHDWDLDGVDRAINEVLPGHERYPEPAKVWAIPRSGVQ